MPHLGKKLSFRTVPYVLLCSFGVFLRLWQYSANRSLWVDEAMLALNIVNRPFASLMRPLDYNQGAPVAFLFIEKFFAELLGNKDYVLRLFPLITSLLGILLMWRAVEIYVSGWARIFALAFFAICEHLVYYASELKQYSSDVACSLLLLIIAPKCLDPHANPKPILLFGFIGAILIWFSHPSVFIVCSVFVVLIVELQKDKESRLRRSLWIGGAGALWLGSFGILFLVSLRFLSSNTALINYWRDALMPVPPWKNLSWFLGAWYGILNDVVGLYLVSSAHAFVNYAIAALATILFVVGCMSLFKHRPFGLLLLIMPFFFALLASATGKYPFTGRLMLFSVPMMILLVAEGIERARRFFVTIYPRAAILATGLLTALFLYRPALVALANIPRPVMKEEIKPAMSYLNRYRLPGDLIYVHAGAIPAFEYYASGFGFQQQDYKKGISFKDGLEKYLPEIEQSKIDHRAWFICSHNCNSCKPSNGPLASRPVTVKWEGALVCFYNATAPATNSDPTVDDSRRR